MSPGGERSQEQGRARRGDAGTVAAAAPGAARGVRRVCGRWGRGAPAQRRPLPAETRCRRAVWLQGVQRDGRLVDRVVYNPEERALPRRRGEHRAATERDPKDPDGRERWEQRRAGRGGQGCGPRCEPGGGLVLPRGGGLPAGPEQRGLSPESRGRPGDRQAVAWGAKGDFGDGDWWRRGASPEACPAWRVRVRT